VISVFDLYEVLKNKGFIPKPPFYYKCVDKIQYSVYINSVYAIWKNRDLILKTDNINEVYCFIMVNF
jgi:hypothetical protein